MPVMSYEQVVMACTLGGFAVALILYSFFALVLCPGPVFGRGLRLYR